MAGRIARGAGVIPWLIGLALGVGSSVIPGPCGLAVMLAAQDGDRSRAIAVAIGAAVGDVTYVTLGLTGVGYAIECEPALKSALQIAGGAMLIAIGVHVLRKSAPAQHAARSAGAGWRGLATGFALLVGNPAALISWGVLVGASFDDYGSAERALLVAGIGCGTAGWFSAIALVVHGRGARLGRLTRIVCALLITYGAFLLLSCVT